MSMPMEEIRSRGEALVAQLRAWSRENGGVCLPYLRRLAAAPRPFLLHTDLRRTFEEELERDPALAQTPLALVVPRLQEAAVDGHRIAFALRPQIGEWLHLLGDAEQGYFEPIDDREYLRFKESVVLGRPADLWAPTFELTPFLRELPRMSETRSIGRGAAFLNRTLSSRLFGARSDGDRRLLEFLRLHQARGQQQIGRAHV